MSIKEHLKITKEALGEYGYKGLGRLSFASLEETCDRAMFYFSGLVAVAFVVGVIIGLIAGRA